MLQSRLELWYKPMWITWICVSKINFHWSSPRTKSKSFGPPGHSNLRCSLTNPSPDKSPCMLAPTPFFTTKSFLSLLVFATNISVVPKRGWQFTYPLQYFNVLSSVWRANRHQPTSVWAEVNLVCFLTDPIKINSFVCEQQWAVPGFTSLQTWCQ